MHAHFPIISTSNAMADKLLVDALNEEPINGTTVAWVHEQMSEDNAQLKEANKALRANINESKKEKADLKKENEALMEEVVALKEKNQAMKDQNWVSSVMHGALEEKVAELTRNMEQMKEGFDGMAAVVTKERNNMRRLKHESAFCAQRFQLTLNELANVESRLESSVRLHREIKADRAYERGMMEWQLVENYSLWNVVVALEQERQGRRGQAAETA